MTNQADNAFLVKKRALFDKLYGKLNEKQREALYTVEGPLLVLAGAGSGKTTVLVNRIAHLISFGNLYYSETVPEGAEALLPQMDKLLQNGTENEIRLFLGAFAEDKVSPHEVLCITFTNKAASEFKARLEKLLGEASKDLWAGTFHSICVRILRRHIELLGYNSAFTIYDADDSKRVINDIMKRLEIDEEVLTPRTILNNISRAKERLIQWREYAEDADGDARREVIAKVYKEYTKALKDANALDFDDIILLTLKLFKEEPEVLAKYQNRFKYILADEYQDTNLSQSELINKIGAKYRNVCVVGDDDQSIYAFRGASVENILGFDRVYKDCKTVRLEQNYRSTQTILSAANAVISNNTGRMGKNLWTDMGDGERILLKKQFTQSGEAGYIVNYIKEQVAEGKADYSDFAVLYRLNAQANTLEIIFSKSRVPYRIFGGVRFYERKEIKDLIAYLAVISNPADDTRIKRIINVPKRGIGATTTNALFELAETEGNVYSVLSKLDDYPEIGKGAPKLKAFYELMESLRAYAQNHKPSEVIKEVIARTGYREMLNAEDEPDKAELLDELVSSAMAFEEQSETPDLDTFLGEIALVTDIDNYDTEANAVTLMTIHSAKGLEFPTVFLPGFEEGVFPGDQSVQSEKELEEERRLAYVAITRAKKQLIITHTNTRLLYGQTKQNALSRFATEIPKHLVTIEQPVKTVYSNVSEAKRRYVSSQESFIKNTRMAPVEKKPSKPTFQMLSQGDAVEHLVFGKGKINNVTDMGGDALYEIEFDTVGTKKIMATYAKLKKL
ncbi:MAG: UvrD-helicase domain-containing protein [Clostridia bacterium]|nr:UvrD-helicase domain-containing protein [Clostridia bacterium]